jgi:PAS domain S-box-containing protein
MSAPTRPRRSSAAVTKASPPKPASPKPPDDVRPEGDPDGGAGDLHQILTSAVEETARLLDADGAMVYLFDPATGHLRFAHDAGIDKPRTREWIRSLDLAPGVGMFGRAVAQRSVVITSDYKADPSFRHAPKTDRIVDDLGIRSMVVAPLKAGDEVFGALGTFSRHAEAFDAADVALVRSLAEHAASAMANQRLIDELDRSRQELDRSRAETARRADAEQALREIAARITALRDPAEILQSVIELASRLVRGDGAILDLLDPATGNLHWAYDDGVKGSFSDEERANLWISIGEGATGTAVAEDRVIVAGDHLDTLFPEGPENTMFYERTGFRSMIAAPISGENGPLGVIEVYAIRPDAFDDADARLIRALASQSAIAITNARLISELRESRTALARTADVERTLREIAASVSAMRDKDEILQAVVDAATRLLRSTGAMIDLLDPDKRMAGAWSFRHVEERYTDAHDHIIETELEADVGVSGLAIATKQVARSGDYPADERFRHSPDRDAFVREMDIKSVIAAPLLQGGEVLGAITVYADRRDAFDDQDAAVLAGLAAQAAVAIANVQLITQLEMSRGENERRADAERTLRGIAARVSAILDPAEVLDRIVHEATRLLESDGSRIDLWHDEQGALLWAYSAGEAMAGIPAWGPVTGIKPGQAVAGLAFSEQRPLMTADYLADDRFATTPEIEAFITSAGIRSVIAVPLTGEDAQPLGVLTVVSRQPGAYTDSDVETLTALASHASIAIGNAKLVEALARTQADVARRADSERSLRQIAARITALRDPDEILQDVVDAARRLLEADGAHLTRMGPTGSYLVPAVVAGGADPATREWLIGMRFPLGGGINGLAAQDGTPIWTADYRTDERIPHEGNDDEVADRMGLVGMAAAPLRAPGGDVIGTLAVSTNAIRTFEADEIELLQGLADQAAIALTNSNLLERLTQEEARYRYLVQNAPDLIWSIDDEAHLTFLSEAVERLTGFRADELLGQHFGALVHESSTDVATFDWTEAMEEQSQEVRGRLNLRHRDGSAVPAEFIAIATLDADGKFAGANGSVRDMRERDRLERELRESEDRYRNLASSSPDLVFATDAQGRYTFLSDRATTMLGWDRDEALGRMFLDFVAPGWEAEATTSYRAVVADPSTVHSARIDFLKGDGSQVELEINVLGKVEDGKLVGINGVARDISERLRLERELSQSEERYRFLIQNSPDIVFATDADGRFTFLSDAIERMIGIPAADAIGQHFSILVESSTMPIAGSRWAELVAHPEHEVQADLILKGHDGQRVPVDVRAIGVVADGEFAGIQGATRDVSDKVRLEGELRRQAGELAAGEERAHLARELHDSVTQALFSMTLVSRSIEMLLDRDSDAAREQLGQLRELQREALAEMRALIFELRPGNLEQEGLVRALKTHAAALQGRLGLPIVVESDLVDRLPLAAEEVLYRIAQEALHNVVKHASAQQVRVEVHREGGAVRLRVEDDGKGFDPSAVPDGHLGLAGMRVRADRIGAVFSCASRVGEGTTIEVEMGADALAALAVPNETRRGERNAEVTSIRDG